MTTRADRRPGRYVINGKKHWITGGGVSRLHLIFARVFDENGRAQGIGGFLAVRDRDSGTPVGLTIGRREPAMGLRGIPETEVIFQDLEVPDEMVLRRPSGGLCGFSELMNAYNSQRVGAATVALGLAQGAFEAAVGVRQGAPPVRPPDRRVPGPAMDAGRHGDPVERGAAGDLGRPRRPPIRSPIRCWRHRRRCSRRRWRSG